MPKIGRSSGPTNADGTPPRVVERLSGRHVEVLGTSSTMYLGGDLTIDGDLTVAGTASIGPSPTTEDDYAKITENITGIALSNNLLMTAIAGVTCTVADDGNVHVVHAHIEAQCASAGVYAAIYIAPVGSSAITSAVARASIRSNAANVDESADAWARLAAGVSGEYGAFISAASGTWQITAAEFAPCDIQSLAV